MDLDIVTLRVAFAVLSLMMLALFYFVTFRTTRSRYSGWWCAAVAAFLSGSAAYLLDGTSQQVWANPLGNGLIVLGAASAWAATRSLGGLSTSPLQLSVAPVVTVLAAVVDDPATNVWSGGPIFLGVMSVMFGLSARELFRMDRDLTGIQTSMTLVTGLASAYYAGRCVAFVADGPEGPVFTTYFGSAVTTLISMALLATVSFSMSVLSNEQSTRDLVRQATTDGLTGLLNRTRFLDLVTRELRQPRRPRSDALILADLDHFKAINDTHGHQAGDDALRAFAAACRQTVRSTDLIGRFGGEEFVLHLPGATLDMAEQVAMSISSRLQSMTGPGGIAMPTVSYGIVEARSGGDLTTFIAAADAALYQAKVMGRDRIVRGDRPPADATETTNHRSGSRPGRPTVPPEN